MKQDQFDEVLERRVNYMWDTLSSKAKEYACGTDNDRLHNFKVAAMVKGETVQKALWGMMVKHLVSVIDIIEGDLEQTQHNIDEKIGDLINYLVLLEASFKDK